MSESAELVERAREGCKDSFAKLYDQHARLVRAICFDATGHLVTAEDLSQDVFLKAYERLDQLKDAERFVPWLCGIARRVGHDWHRRNRREPVEAVPDASAELVDREAAEDLRLAELREAVRQLPEQERMAIHLFYLEEQPAEMARQVLGISQSGFYKLLERAREHAGAIMRRMQEDLPWKR